MKLGNAMLIGCSSALALLSFSTSAQQYRPVHPGYLQALQDLRYARGQLAHPETPVVQHDEEIAISEIDGAIGEIRRASIDDGKNLSDHPPVDLGSPYIDRFHRALELLNHARHECEREEDNPEVRGMREHAIGHIDAAMHATRHAVGDALQ